MYFGDVNLNLFLQTTMHRMGHFAVLPPPPRPHHLLHRADLHHGAGQRLHLPRRRSVRHRQGVLPRRHGERPRKGRDSGRCH